MYSAVAKDLRVLQCCSSSDAMVRTQVATFFMYPLRSARHCWQGAYRVFWTLATFMLAGKGAYLSQTRGDFRASPVVLRPSALPAENASRARVLELPFWIPPTACSSAGGLRFRRGCCVLSSSVGLVARGTCACNLLE